MCRGSGDGTTRRQLSPSGLNTQPFAALQRVRLRPSCRSGPTNLVGSSNAGSSGSTCTIVRIVASGASGGIALPSSCSRT